MLCYAAVSKAEFSGRKEGKKGGLIIGDRSRLTYLNR